MSSWSNMYKWRPRKNMFKSEKSQRLNHSEDCWFKHHTFDSLSSVEFCGLVLLNRLLSSLPSSADPRVSENVSGELINASVLNTWCQSSVRRPHPSLSLQEKTPSGLSSPSRRTRTPTATESSTWRGPGTASLSASSCATRSGTRSTWATRLTVSSLWILLD